jgi:hypothetical protein
LSWFNLGVSKEELEQMDREFERKYGKDIKRLSEIKEFESLPIDDDDKADHEEVNTMDENKDEKFDYSDLED